MDLARSAVPDVIRTGEPDDEAIAARAREDRSAFAELYVRHRDSVLGYLRARTACEDDAVELTAMTFERALVAIDRYSTRGAGVRAWLFRIARNAALDEHRRRSRLAHRSVAPAAGDDIRDSAPGPDDAAERSEDLIALRAGFARLTNDQRDALGLRFGAGLTAREIGSVIGKREAAVQKLVERAIDRLREAMA